MSKKADGGVNDEAGPSRLRIARALIIVAVGALTVAFFFRYQISNGFSLLLSDRFDGFLELSILEHWYNVLQGKSYWNQTNYFYPVPGALGYNDGYFIYGLIYSVFRTGTIDPFLSGELVTITIRAIGFPAFYFACRVIFRLDWKWALLGAILFTISANSFIRANHQQLLGVSFVPLLALLLYGSIVSLGARSNVPLLAYGSAFILLLGSCLMTFFYMSWYFIFFCLATFTAWCAFAGRESVARLGTALRRHIAPLAVLAGLAVLANLPFLSLYLPKAAETGIHSYAEAFSFTPSLLDVVHLNLLFDDLQDTIYAWFRPDLPSYSELSTGFSPALLVLFVCAVLFVCRKSDLNGADRTRFLRALAVATVATWAISLHFGRVSAWYAVYNLVPGAKAARVVARYQIFLTAPVIALAMVWLAAYAKRLGASVKIVSVPILAAIAVGLMAEEISLAGLALDRPHELARLESVPSPPPTCKAFFVSAARPEQYQSPLIDGIYSHNADAMLIAEVKNLPTMNGFSTFVPPDWNLADPDSVSYPDRVRAYASKYGLHNLCALNLKTMSWSASP